MPTILRSDTFNSKENAYWQMDYPFGFKLRCIRRCWIETKAGHGQRLVLQTTKKEFNTTYEPPKDINLTDPANQAFFRQQYPGVAKHAGYWNLQKTSTYSMILVMTLDADGHLTPHSLSAFASIPRIQEFEAQFGDALDEYQKRALASIRMHP